MTFATESCTEIDDAQRLAAVHGLALLDTQGEPEFDELVRFAVTISAGVACFSPASPSGARLVTLADEALYAAKRAGKDRVIGYGRYFNDVVCQIHPDREGPAPLQALSIDRRPA